MPFIRSGEISGHVGFPTKTRPDESAEVTAVSGARDRSFPRCSGGSDAVSHVCIVGLPPEFHSGYRNAQQDRGSAA